MGLFSRLLKRNRKRKYDAASNNDGRTFGAIGRTALNPNTELKFSGRTLRQRSADVYQNTATGRAAVESLVASVIGQGIDIEPDTGRETRDKALHEAWRLFADQASVCGRFTLEDMQVGGRTRMCGAGSR